jgi:epoxyqueuosine reductase
MFNGQPIRILTRRLPNGQMAMLTPALKTEAQRLGFDLVAVAPAVVPAGFHPFLDWLDRGYAGEMHYLPRRAAAYGHPQNVLAGVRSVVMLGLNYNAPSGRSEGAAGSPGCVEGRVARYALGATDYHDLIHGRLDELAEFVRRRHPESRTRGVVDTAPLLERDFARLAGLGWFGKNTMLIHKRLGSWFFLAGLLTDLELEYDAPHESAHCGTCTRCLEACPTGAFTAPYVLDARRCISYLTIEHRGAIPAELREGMGEWLFGCDICQEVCPWNRKAPSSDDPAFAPRGDLALVDAAALLSLTDDEFRALFRGTPLTRPKRAGLLRNAAIVLGNRRDRSAIPALLGALADGEPLVRGAAVWALSRFADPAVDESLRKHRGIEEDQLVLEELDAALAANRNPETVSCPH